MTLRRFFAIVCLMQLPTALFAQSQEPLSGFVPIDQLPPADQLPAAPYLVTAYAIVWIAVILYTWSVWRRMDRVEKDIRELKRRNPLAEVAERQTR